MADKLPPINLPEDALPWAKAIQKKVFGNESKIAEVRTNQTAAAQGAASTAQHAGNTSSQVDTIAAVPSSVTDLTLTSGSYFDTAAVDRAYIDATWTAITTAVDGSEMTPQYELWFCANDLPYAPSSRATATSDTTARVDSLETGQLYTLRVRTISPNGVAGDFSGPVSITTLTVDAVPPTPTFPTVNSALGAVSVGWNGNDADGAPMPNWVAYVQPYISDTSGGTYVATGTPMQEKSDSAVNGLDVGDTYFFRLGAVSNTGVQSPLSAATEAVVAGVDLGDLDDEVSGAITAAQDAADAAQGTANAAATAAATAQTTATGAQTTADGKNTVTYSLTAPVSATGTKLGDIWYVINASNVVTAMYISSGSAWTARTLDNATIANLDAGKITAGTINAARIGANSITTAKLLVSNYANLLEDAGFESNSTTIWPNLTTNVTKATGIARTGTYALRMKSSTAAYEATRHADVITVEEGQQYLYSGWVKSATVGTIIDGGIELSVAWGSSTAVTNGLTLVGSSSGSSPTTWTYFSGIWTVPPLAKYCKPRIFVRDTSNVNVYALDDLGFSLMTPASLIVDGAITSQKLAAESVIAGKIAANAITADNIQAGAITAAQIAAGAITSNEIAAGTIEANNIAAGAITTNLLSPTVGAELDITANDTVTIIAGQVDTVQSGLNDTTNNLEEMQTYYTFGPDGAIISTPDSPFSVALRSDRIEMLESGNVVSYWNSGQMFVSQLVGEKVILGNHQLEKYETGTVVRAL